MVADVTARVEIRLFGDPHVSVDGASWKIRMTPSCWSLLALLAGQRQPVHRATIAPMLWPDALDSDALANLRRHLHILTRALPPCDAPWIVADSKTVAWNHVAPARIDVVEFQKAIARGRDREIVELYSADLLTSAFDDAIVELRERLRTGYLDALERLVNRARNDHDYQEALRYAEMLLAADEWREDTVRLAMTIRYEKGDRPGAIATYERFAESLHRELRAQPMNETKALRDAILTGTALPHEAPKLRSVERDTGLKFVGRTAELQTLRNAWVRAARGRGSTILLTGEPGIGKSRLSLELCAIVEGQSGCAIVGRTASPEGCAFQPVIEALREGLALLSPGDLEGAWIAPVMTILPEIERVSAGEIPSLEAFDAGRARLRLREGLVRVVAAMARRRPLVIVLEDVHWAGRDTLEFIEMLAHRVAGLPVLLVLTYRPGDLSSQHALHAMRRELQHARRGQTVALTRFGQTELADLALEVLGGDATVALLKRLQEATEGNPLFAVQILRHVAETGELPSAERALQSVAGTVVSRLERLTSESRSIADVAASIGGNFSIEEIARVGGWEEPVVLDALGRLLDARIVCERGGERFAYGFTHALIEAAIRDVAARGDRRMRHYRIAEVLTATRETDPAAAALIASHWEAAGEAARAAAAALRAAQVEMQRFAWNETIHLARRAIAGGLENSQRFEALLAIAEASFRLADPESAANDIAEMQRLAARLGVEQRVQALIMEVRYAENTGDRAKQKRAIEQLEAVTSDSNSDRWRAELQLTKAKWLFLRGSLAEAEATIREAVEFARSTGDAELLWRTREILIQNLLRQGKVAEGSLEIDSVRTEAEAGDMRAREALGIGLVRLAVATQESKDFQTALEFTEELSRELSDVRSSLVFRNELSYYLHHNWNTSESRASYEAASSLTKEHGLLQLWVTSRVNLGMVEWEIGHFERARALWKEARSAAKRLKVVTTLACCAINFGGLDLELGDYDNALKEARAGLDLAQQSGSRQFVAEALNTLGAVECAKGDVDVGLARMREGLQLQRPLGSSRWLARELCLYLEALLQADRLEEATAVAGELRALYDKDPEHQVAPGRIALALANAASAIGNEADARKLKERGRRSVQFVLARLTDPTDREAFAAMPYNKKLVE